MLRKNKAFTLVELLVVITILSILGTIGFISLQGYSRDARDTTRIADLNLINKVLNLSNISNGNFPDPTNYTNITYSGSTIWKQGVFGTGTFGDLAGSISKIPLDPLTNSNYTYSLSSNGKEFQVGGISEGGVLSLIKPTYADGLTYESIIVGKYNGKASKVIVGNDTYFLAVPSLITSDISLIDYYDIISNNKLVYNNKKNLPASYTGTKVDLFGDSTNYMVNSGSYVLLKKSNNDLINKNITMSDLEKVGFNIDQSYEGGLLEGKGNIDLITRIDTSFDDQAGILGEDIMCNVFNICVKYKYIQWYTDVDTNCNQPDVRITLLDGTKQIWAGCNSTLGLGKGFYRGGHDSSSRTCKDYDGGQPDGDDKFACFSDDDFTKKELPFFNLVQPDGENDDGNKGFDTIWGKMYNWNDMSNNCEGGDFVGGGNINKCACPSGWHIPTESEYRSLADKIKDNNSDKDDDGDGSTSSDYISWVTHEADLNNNKNMVSFLKVPLSGYLRDDDAGLNRGQYFHLFTSNDSGGNVKLFQGYEGTAFFEIDEESKDDYYSVRCLKD